MENPSRLLVEKACAGQPQPLLEKVKGGLGGEGGVRARVLQKARRSHVG